MIEAYSWCTPNGHKLHIMLEETGLEYSLKAINIGKGEQFEPKFLKLSLNGKIPAIVDTDGPDGKPFALAESGAILMYLAEKCGMLLPRTLAELHAMRQWLFFQVAHVGPMFGQAHHFTDYAPEKVPYAIERYTREARRLTAVLDRRLSENEYLAGSEYSIADIATYPWLVSGAKGVAPGEFPSVERWLQTLRERPAVARGMDWLSEHALPSLDEEARRQLFGRE